MLIGGAVLLVVGLVLFFIRWSQAGKLTQMAAAQALKCAEVESFCRDAGEGGADRHVEVTGVIEARTALKAELSGQDCVAYRTQVEREWEEEKWEQDSKGERRRTTRRGSDTLSRNERLEPFYVRDDSGRILVDPQGADIDWVRSVERFEPGQVPPGQGDISAIAVQALGSVATALAGGLAPSAGRRTLGHRYSEWVLPVGRPVYLLGGAALRSGEACFQHPASGKRFLISLKMKEQLAARARRAVAICTVLAAVCCAAGATLILLGLGS